MAMIVNGVNIENVIANGQQIETVVCNGTIVWTKSKPKKTITIFAGTDASRSHGLTVVNNPYGWYYHNGNPPDYIKFNNSIKSSNSYRI